MATVGGNWTTDGPGRWRGAVGVSALCAAVWLIIGQNAQADVGATDGRRTVASGPVRVRYWTEHVDIALKVAGYARGTAQDLQQYLDIQMQDPITINIARTQREFNRHAGKKAFSWTLGVARPAQNSIVLQPVEGSAMRRLVIHEMTHLALGRKMAGEGHTAPRWVHEGLAQWMEGEMPGPQKAILGRAAIDGELLNLSGLDAAFEAKRETVQLAYAQSHALVGCMIEHGPMHAVGDFLNYLADTGDQQLALRRAMGMPLETVEKLWLQDIKTKYMKRGLPPAADTIALVVMGLVFVVVVVVRMRRAREIRRRMQQEEQMEELMARMELIGENQRFAESEDRGDG